MTLLSSVSLRAFDSEAAAEIRALIRSHQVHAALDRMREYRARDRAEEIQFFGLRASASYHAGEFENSIRDWTRALHATSHSPEWKSKVRTGIAEALIRVGNPARAERVLQRSITDIRAGGGPPAGEVWALNTLIIIQYWRGTLSVGRRLGDLGMSLIGDGTADRAAWAAIRVNTAHPLIRLGEFTRAADVLSEIETSDREVDLYNCTAMLLTRVMLALESEDFEGCERVLARIDPESLGDNIRWRIFRLQFEGALRIAMNGSERALDCLEQALQIARAQLPAEDQLSEILRVQACALLELGRPREALEVAREAIRTPGIDMIDSPAGHRVAAKCLAALGRSEEARVSLATALTQLEPTEFVVERRRLHRDMESLGMALPGSRIEVSSPEAAGDTTPWASRFLLADRRLFLTSDGDLSDRIRAAAETRLPVLIEGETGTGKELVARLLHETGSASHGPFVVVDCTTLTEGLAEAELFGVARGAYTGAIADRVGLVGAANGGTLLFDELPELSLAVQSKLLRLLQEGTYRRLGEARSRQVRVRVIATTNREPDRLLAQGTLKPDLFFRLHGHRIRLRPLRERPRDVALLAQHFGSGEGFAAIAPDALAELRAASWPGNVRQLEMLIRVAASTPGAGRILEKSLVRSLLEEAPDISPPSSERSRLEAALDAHSGNVAAAARALGISRQGLYKALRRNGLR